MAWGWAHEYCQSNPVDVAHHLVPQQVNILISLNFASRLDHRYCRASQVALRFIRNLHMPHLISSMAYTNAPPWHGLGNRLTEKQPIEVWAQQAGMNWHIRQSPVYFHSQRKIASLNSFRTKLSASL